MTGIEINKLENLIQKNKYLFEGVTSNSKTIINLSNKMADCYNGSSLNSMFSIVDKQQDIFNDINSLLDSYLVLLDSVKKSYVLQEIIFAEQINKNIN